MKFLQRIQQGILAVCLGVLLGGSFAESQTATLQIDSNINIYHVRQRGKQGGVWEKGRDSLTAAVLKTHLSTLGINSFKELGRLILAQGVYGSNGISYDHDNSDNIGPNYINRQRAGSLYKTPTLSDLVDHLFDHGHLGWYPHAQQINMGDFNAIVGVNPQVAPRGIFNINSTIRGRIGQALTNYSELILVGVPPPEDYRVDPQPSRMNPNPPCDNPNLEEAAINLITCLFSSNTFGGVQIGLVSDERFTIDARYHGVPIQGIDYTHPTVSPPPDNCLGLQSNGTPTNRICLVVGVYNGTIYIASLYPEG